MLHKIGIFRKRAAAIFANEHFRAPLPEAKLVHHAVHACQVRLERTALCERLVTSAALKWLYSCVCPYMALQIEGIIEAFGTELAVITFIKGVSLHVAIEKALERERTVTNLAFVFRLVVFAHLSVLVLVLEIRKALLLLVRWW